MSPETRKRIFISYARSDGETYGKELRAKLVAEFSEEQIWHDRDELEGGVGWWQQIEEALEAVDFMVLIASPAAMASSVVRREWRKARQEGVCVYPVQVPGLPIDFPSLPNWMRDAHFYTLEKEWDNFIAHLRAPCQALRVPFYGVPDLPQHFVERPEEFDALLSQLLDDKRDNSVAITTSLTGAGGFGKTTLASALCHDEKVQTAFDDGVLWVTLGEHPNVTAELTKMYRALTDENPGFVDANEGANMLAEKLADRDILMVIDDVWNPAHLRPFLKGGKRCARLITTRNINIATGANANTNNVDEMSTAQAVKMLLGGLETPDDIAPFETLAKRLGEWALMLEITNGMLKNRIALGNSLERALNKVNRALDKEGVSGLERKEASERRQSAEGVLAASFAMIEDEQPERLFQLAVFRDDADIPLSSIMKRWHHDDEDDSDDLLEQYALYSFIRYDAERGIVRIHDVVREVLEGKLTATLPIEAAHKQLIEAYGLEPENWAGWDNYTWQNIGYHLNAAGMLPELKALLLNIDFLQAKLEQTNPNALIDDCDYFKGENGTFTDDSMRLMQSAISMSSHVLVNEPSQLSGQLYARSMSHDNPDIVALLEKIRERDTIPLYPLYQTMQAAGGALIRTLEGHTSIVTGVALSGDIAISASWDDTLIVWDWRTGEQLRRLKGHTNSVSSVTIQGDVAISASQDNTLIVWNWQTGEHLRTLKGHTSIVNSVAIQGDIAISASEDETLRVWNWQTGEWLRILKGHTSAVTGVALQGDIAISASWGDTLIVWDWRTGEHLRRLEGHTSAVNSVAIQGDIAISASGSRFGSSDNTLIVWNWQIGEQLRRLEGHISGVTSVAIEGDVAISASYDKSLIVWNPQSGEQLRRLERQSDSMSSVAVSGAYVISASFDSTLRVWNWQSGEAMRRLERHTASVNSVAVSGAYAISASGSLGESDNTLRVWNWQSGEEIRRLEGHAGYVNSVALSGELAISAASDRSLRVWNWMTGEHLRSLEGHSNRVTSVAIEGEYAVSASFDKTLRVWNWQTGEHLATFHCDSPQNTVAIGDGVIVSGGADGQVHFFRPNAALKTLLGW